jgi:hypothetical protein
MERQKKGKEIEIEKKMIQRYLVCWVMGQPQILNGPSSCKAHQEKAQAKVEPTHQG